MTEPITSADNKLFKLWHALNAAKGVDKHGLAIVSGRKIVPELARTAGEGATVLLREGDTLPPFTEEGDNEVVEGGAAGAEQVAPSSGPGDHLPRERGRKDGLRIAHLAAPLFETLDEFGTQFPLLVLPTPTLTTFAPAAAPSGLEIAVAAQDPSNLGAILRSALAFGAARVILLQECAHPFLPKVTRAAAGANFRLALARGPSIRVIESGFVALDMAGEPIDTFAFPRDCRLLLGEEGGGIPATFNGTRVKIPIAPQAESLNVAVAAGVALAAFRRRHPL